MIIAVLAAMLLPAVQLVREAACTMRCQSNLHQCYLALAAYSQDWDGQLPLGQYWVAGGENTVNTDWWAIVSSYDGGQGTTYVTSEAELSNTGLFRCPSLSREGRAHYAAHPKLMPSIDSPAGYAQVIRLGQIRRAGQAYDSRKLACLSTVSPEAGPIGPASCCHRWFVDHYRPSGIGGRASSCVSTFVIVIT